MISTTTMKRYYFENMVLCGNCNGSGLRDYMDYCRCCNATGIESFQEYQRNHNDEDPIMVAIQYNNAVKEINNNRYEHNHK